MAATYVALKWKTALYMQRGVDIELGRIHALPTLTTAQISYLYCIYL